MQQAMDVDMQGGLAPPRQTPADDARRLQMTPGHVFDMEESDQTPADDANMPGDLDNKQEGGIDKPRWRAMRKKPAQDVNMEEGDIDKPADMEDGDIDKSANMEEGDIDKPPGQTPGQ